MPGPNAIDDALRRAVEHEKLAETVAHLTWAEWVEEGGCGMAHRTSHDICRALNCAPRALEGMKLCDLFAIGNRHTGAGTVLARTVGRWVETEQQRPRRGGKKERE